MITYYSCIHTKHFVKPQGSSRYFMANTLVLAFLALITCFLDVVWVGFYGQPLLLSLFCLYSLQLFASKKTLLPAAILILLTAQIMMLGGSWGVQLLSVLSLSALALEIKSLLNNTAWLPYLFLASNIVSTHLLQSSAPLLSPTGTLFVFKQICVNLVVLFFFEKTLSQR